jgi:NHL repeat
MKKLSAILILFALAAALRAQDSVTTFAGRALVSGAADGSGTNARFADPAAIVTDAVENFFIADSANHAIRKIATNGAVTTFAGKLGVSGIVNANGTNAQFNAPSGLAFDASGNLFVSDTGNHVIRKITTAGAVSTFAGVAGSGGFLDGANGNAFFSSPLGIAVWTNGNVFVADSGNHCIRKIAGGAVTTFAGNPQVWGSADGVGTNALFNSPCGLAFDANGNLFVSDANNDTIRKILTNGIVTTFAGAAGQDGAADGVLSLARFRSPASLAFDKKGNLFVADSFNQTVREISSNGIVSTVCGAPEISGAADGTNGVARFFNPYGLAVAADGSLVVADAYNQLVRVVLVPFKVSLQISGVTKISWDAVIGKSYQAQFKTDLSAAAWMNLGSPLTANSLSLSATDAAGGTRFYRILRLN